MVPEGEEDEMENNGESITDVNVLGAQILQDKSPKQKLVSRFRCGKFPAQIKRKLPQEMNSPRKYCAKENKPVEQQAGVQLIQATTINANDILDTNNHQQVSREFIFHLPVTSQSCIVASVCVVGRGECSLFRECIFSLWVVLRSVLPSLIKELTLKFYDNHVG